VLKPSPPYLGFVAASAGLLDEVIAEVGNVTKVNGEMNGHGHGSVNGLTNGVRKISLSNSGSF